MRHWNEVPVSVVNETVRGDVGDVFVDGGANDVIVVFGTVAFGGTVITRGGADVAVPNAPTHVTVSVFVPTVSAIAFVVALDDGVTVEDGCRLVIEQVVPAGIDAAPLTV